MAWPIMVIEVQPSSGNDTYGGRFDPALAGGVDMTQSTPVVFDGTVVYLTAAGAQTTAVVVGVTPLASWVGNCLYVTAGTNATPARYRITVVSSQTLTLVPVAGSGNWCTGAVTNGAGYLGGPFKTISAVITDTYVASSKIFVKAEVLAMPIQTATGFAFLNCMSWVIGYTTIRGDGGKPTLQATAPSIKLVAFGQYLHFWNFVLDCNAQASTYGAYMQVGGAPTELYNCRVINSSYYACANVQGGSLIWGCEFTACGGNYVLNLSASSFAFANYIHQCTCSAIYNASSISNIIDDVAGVTSDGIYTSGAGSIIVQNLVTRTGRYCIATYNGSAAYSLTKGNILANAGRSTGANAAAAYGLAETYSPGATGAAPGFDGNAYYNNLSGSRYLVDVVTGIYGIAPYTNVLDVYSANALFDANFNPTSYARGNGQPSTWPGLASTTGHPDFGAVQASISAQLIGGGKIS